MAYTLRQHLGTLIYDWPRFAWSMARRRGWVRFRNRRERLTIDPGTGGARCRWQFTSDLHLCNVFPATGLWLLRRTLGDWPIAFAGRPESAGEPRVSFIIGHRGQERASHLLKTIATIAAQREVAVECIVVEQSERPFVRTLLPDWVRYIHTPIESDSLPYNRSWTLNAGARAARAPLLVLHDNDFLVPAAYAAELARRHDEGWQYIDLKRFMFFLTTEESGRLARSERFSVSSPPERVTQNLGGGGSIAADRDAYFAIGGFDESFVGWGGEDNDFWERAATGRCFTNAYLPFVHLWHAPQPEKATAQVTGGRLRLLEVSKLPPAERIARLLKKS